MSITEPTEMNIKAERCYFLPTGDKGGILVILMPLKADIFLLSSEWGFNNKTNDQK